MAISTQVSVNMTESMQQAEQLNQMVETGIHVYVLRYMERNKFPQRVHGFDDVQVYLNDNPATRRVGYHIKVWQNRYIKFTPDNKSVLYAYVPDLSVLPEQTLAQLGMIRKRAMKNRRLLASHFYHGFWEIVKLMTPMGDVLANEANKGIRELAVEMKIIPTAARKQQFNIQVYGQNPVTRGANVNTDPRGKYVAPPATPPLMQPPIPAGTVPIQPDVVPAEKMSVDQLEAVLAQRKAESQDIVPDPAPVVPPAPQVVPPPAEPKAPAIDRETALAMAEEQVFTEKAELVNQLKAKSKNGWIFTTVYKTQILPEVIKRQQEIMRVG